MKKYGIIFGVILLLLGAISVTGNENAQQQSLEEGLFITHPNGGEILSGDVDIQWYIEGVTPACPEYFNIFYQYSGEGWTTIGIDIFVTSYSYTWDTEGLPRGQYKIKVQLALDCDMDGHGETIYFEDISDGWFTLPRNREIVNNDNNMLGLPQTGCNRAS